MHGLRFLRQLGHDALQGERPGAKASNERLLVYLNTGHWNGCRQSEHSNIQGVTVLPFRKKALSVQRPKLTVA